MVRLTIERKDRGLTQATLQRRSGVHATTLSLIESGRYRPEQPTLERLARALGIPAERAERLLDRVDLEPLGDRA